MTEANALTCMIQLCQQFAGVANRAEGHVPDATTPEAAAALMHYRLNRPTYSNGRIWTWVVANQDADLLQARRALPNENGGMSNPGKSNNDQVKQEFRYCHRALELINGNFPKRGSKS